MMTFSQKRSQKINHPLYFYFRVRKKNCDPGEYFIDTQES